MNDYGIVLALLFAVGLCSCSITANREHVGVVSIDSGVFIVTLKDSVVVPLLKVERMVNSGVWAVDSSDRVYIASEDRKKIYVYTPVNETAYAYKQEISYDEESEVRDLMVVGNKLLVGGYREEGNLWYHSLNNYGVSTSSVLIGNVGGITKGIDHLVTLGSEIYAIDNIVVPIYILTYDIIDETIVSTGFVRMPVERSYEHYLGAVADGRYLYTLSSSSQQMGHNKFFQVYDPKTDSIAYVLSYFYGWIGRMTLNPLVDPISREGEAENEERSTNLVGDDDEPLDWSNSFVSNSLLSDSLLIDNDRYKWTESRNTVEKIYDNNGSVFILVYDGTVYRVSFDKDRGMIYQIVRPKEHMRGRRVSSLLWLDGVMIFILSSD